MIPKRKIRRVFFAAVLALLSLAEGAWSGDLISHWMFDEGSGTVANDSLGGNHGTIYGAEWAAGQISCALSFDGLDDYVDLDAHVGDFRNLSAGTICAWIKDAGGGGVFFSGSNGVNVDTTMYLSVTEDKKIKVRVCPHRESKIYWESTPTLDGGWHHFAFATGSSGNRMYLDGAQVTGTYRRGGPSTNAFFSTVRGQNNLRIGNLYRNNESTSYFNGSIDDVRVYRRGLLAEEIQQIYVDSIGDVVGLGITGPEKVAENSSAQYTATATFEDGFTADVTDTTIWSSEPDAYTSIANGLLSTGHLETSEYVYIHAEYSKREVTIEAEMTVEVALPVELVILGPNQIPDNFQTQYGAVVHYDNGESSDVTDAVLWSVEPQEYASIDANGLVWTEDIDVPVDIIISARYTAANVTSDAQMSGEIYLSRTLYVPGGYKTIQAAVDEARHGDTVVVANGTYTGDGNRDIDFLGKAIAVCSQSGPENCIIDCNGSKDDRHRAFYFNSGEGSNCVVDGFTVMNGYYGSGGFVYCREASPTVGNCILYGGLAKAGGAIYSKDSSLTISNCTITDNSADSGGGIYCNGGNLTMVRCTVTANSSEWGGGGMRFYDGASVRINSSSISYNAAGYEGGAVSCLDSVVRATNCAITDNLADFQGGGVYCDRSNAIINNCTISGNSAPVGGGIHCYEGNLTIDNSILSGNQPEQIALEYQGTVSVTYSNIQGGPEGVRRECHSDCSLDWGPGNIYTEPGFAFSSDYHLVPDSPCIDTGDPNYMPEPNETDLDGNPRVINGQIDMGAYEYNSQRPSIAVSSRAVSLHYLQDGPKPDAQTLSIRNCGGGKLRWEIIETCDWLDVAPRHGMSSGGIDEVRLRVEPEFLPAGLHSCTLRFAASDAANSPVTVKVDIGVGVTLRVPEDFTTIQAAIDASEDYDMVVVADGTYTGEGNRDIDFSGKAITVKSENGPENCIIDCNGTEDKRHRAFYFQSGERANSVVEGLTLTNGWASDGGSICAMGSPTITNCIIRNNSAQHWGAGIYCGEGSPRITRCTISKNDGEGIFCLHASPTISNCTIAQNDGRGIGCTGYNSYATISGCIIKDNWGGGVYCTLSASPRIANCSISGNSAEVGGGIKINRSDAAIINCTITGNSATIYQGGGIYVYDSDARVKNCIIRDNWPEQIYGISNSSPSVTYNNIQADTDEHYERDDRIWTGEGNIDSDPCFVEVGYWDVNGVWVEGDYRLLETSPCIDIGDPNYLPEPNETDLDGNPRILDGDDNGVAIVDMGAYEHSYGGLYLGVSPRELVFYLREDCEPEPQVISIVNIGSGTLRWKITEDCPWVEVNPTRGKSRGEVEKVNVTVDTSGLDFGVYTCELVVSAGSTVRSPQTVKITLHYFEYVEGAIYVPVEYPTIQGAIDAAEDGQMVIVFAGNYKGDGNRDIDFLDKAITVRSESGPENCIIDCNGSESDPHRGFYFHSDEDTNSVLEGFTITNGHASSAGAIYFKGNSNPKIDNCIISQNTARWHGGAIYSIASSPTITNSTINSNAAEYGYGGGIYSYMGSPVVANCSIQSNSAGSSGGGIYCYKNNATVISCTISGNNVPYYSGGLPAGGGIFCLQSTPAIINCTMVGNGAEFGGGIYVRSGTVVVTNCILWDNLSGQIAGSALAAYSDIQGGWDGVGNIDADPGFIQSGTGYLDDNNTPYSWDDFWVWVDGDYRLLADSPCIDAGDPNYMPEPNERDLDGNPRVIDGDEDGTAVVDMGAYEYRPAVEAEVEIRPEVLNLGSEGRWISCRIRLGEGYDVGDIEAGSILLEYEVEAESVKINEEQQVATAKFKRAEVQEIVEAGQVELTVSGELVDGTRFEGTDAITVINRNEKEVKVGKRLGFGRKSGLSEEKSWKNVKKD